MDSGAFAALYCQKMSTILRLRSVGSGLRCAKRTLALSSVSGQKSEFGSKAKAATTKAVVFDMGGVILPSPLPYLKGRIQHLLLSDKYFCNVLSSNSADTKSKHTESNAKWMNWPVVKFLSSFLIYSHPVFLAVEQQCACIEVRGRNG